MMLEIMELMAGFCDSSAKIKNLNLSKIDILLGQYSNINDSASMSTNS